MVSTVQHGRPLPLPCVFRGAGTTLPRLTQVVLPLPLPPRGPHCKLVSHPVLHTQGGTDVGDHPPITPVRAATEEELGGGDAWRLYDFVARHFLGSVSPDAVYKKWVHHTGGGRAVGGGAINVLLYCVI